MKLNSTHSTARTFKNRVAEVNHHLKAMGAEEKLYRGRGYYYFAGGEASGWYSTSVYVFNADDLTLDRWLQEYDWFKRTEGGRYLGAVHPDKQDKAVRPSKTRSAAKVARGTAVKPSRAYARLIAKRKQKGGGW